MIELAALSAITGSVTSLIKGGMDSRALRKNTKLQIELIREERETLALKLKNERLTDIAEKKENALKRDSEADMALFLQEGQAFTAAQNKGGLATFVRPILLLFLGYCAWNYAGESIYFQEQMLELFVMGSSFYFGQRVRALKQ